MSEPAFPRPDASVESIEPETLKERIDAGDDVVVLDTRAPEESESWRIGGDGVETINLPYYGFLVDDPDEELFERLPEDERLVAVCAKGQSSEYVAGLLAERGYDAVHLAEGMNGWARLYEYAELDVGADATVAQYRRPSSGCLAYLIVSGGEAAVVDPLRAFVPEYVRDARALGAEIAYAIDTHVHADHVSGVRALADEAGAEAVIPEPAAARGVEYDSAYATVADGDELPLGDETIEAVHAPGHTTGMTAYRVGDVLLTGDGLFVESVARPDLEDGDECAPAAARRLYETLHERILPLPDDTTVAPGHFSDAATPAADGTYTATLGELKSSMAALSMDEATFVEFVRSDLPPRPANHEEIVATNLGRNEATDGEAFELELGPNNCAAGRDATAGE
ncbi:MBL fold metallo-hydrolase [Halegenticoccus tardaugens]|uniref:MBL fold metallo-hydrolase n=1 Tax=Halegenticoccus tardaugens TaxID=2071624 RepID=UPI00100ACA9A|nr:MBL fold metallo-hydrolase [Halegenticoccus tardaugens]